MYEMQHPAKKHVLFVCSFAFCHAGGFNISTTTKNELILCLCHPLNCSLPGKKAIAIVTNAKKHFAKMAGTL